MDFEPLKLDFKYISKNFSGKGVKIPQVAEVECCSCADTCSGKWECCSNRKKQSLVYDKNKCFTKVGDYSEAIYECNSLCKCGPDCLNRVVQLGSKASLCFFKSADKTLKVKTLRSIRRGQFISEYVGEIISPAAAQKVRSKNEGDLDFVIDMSFYKSHNPYAIDATNFGNAMRILGHSETPNCAVYSVWYDCNDERFPKLAYFALKYIRTGAELTMDYTGGVYVEPAEEDVDEEYDSKSESE